MFNPLQILVRQRRFQLLLVVLVIMSLLIGIVIVPVESRKPEGLITSVETGIWWAVTTITGVGYGDVYPITSTGRLLGMALELLGVLAFGLLVAMVGVAISRKEERWYWNRLHERLQGMENKLTRLEKKEEFSIKSNVR